MSKKDFLKSISDTCRVNREFKDKLIARYDYLLKDNEYLQSATNSFKLIDILANIDYLSYPDIVQHPDGWFTLIWEGDIYGNYISFEFLQDNLVKIINVKDGGILSKKMFSIHGLEQHRVPLCMLGELADSQALKQYLFGVNI